MLKLLPLPVETRQFNVYQGGRSWMHYDCSMTNVAPEIEPDFKTGKLLTKGAKYCLIQMSLSLNGLHVTLIFPR